MLSFRFRVAACYSSSYKDPVDRGPNKFSNGRIFLPVQPVNTTVPILFTRVRTDFCQYQQWIFFFVKASRLLPRKLCNALFSWLLESAYKWNRTGKNFDLMRPKKNLHTLPFKKLQSCARPVKTKGGSVQVFVRSKMCPDLLSGVVSLWMVHYRWCLSWHCELERGLVLPCWSCLSFFFQ